MDLELNSDQALVAQELNRWAGDHMSIPVSLQTEPYLPGEGLADELAAQGYLDIALQPELGALGGVLLLEAVGRTPYAVEVGASGLVAPLLGLAGLPRPLAIIDPANPVTRFLAPRGAALIDAGDQLRLLRCDDRVKSVSNPYPFPYGRFDGDLMGASEKLDVEVQDFRVWRRLALLGESLGAMDAALKLTVDYVKTRVQFRRPIGSFQTVQHKLSECVVLVHGARLLAYRAAVEGPAFLNEAVDYGHMAVNRVALECTQFHGAIGQTMEYPLHLWAYRLRMLQYELSSAVSASRKAGT